MYTVQLLLFLSLFKFFFLYIERYFLHIPTKIFSNTTNGIRTSYNVLLVEKRWYIAAQRISAFVYTVHRFGDQRIAVWSMSYKITKKILPVPWSYCVPQQCVNSEHLKTVLSASHRRYGLIDARKTITVLTFKLRSSSIQTCGSEKIYKNRLRQPIQSHSAGLKYDPQRP